MKKEVKELNSLIEHISQKVVDRNINEKYLMSRMAVIVNEFDPVTNTASIIIPTDLNNSTNYKYPNRTGINKLNSTVWENGQIKTYGDKVYLIYQTNNISQGWLESNKSLKLESSNLPNLEQLKSALDLDNVENKSASDILDELEDSHISEALGYTPYDASNPDGYTTNTGTVTSVVAGTGLTGDTITSSGTIALDTTRAVSVADINTGVNNDNKLISARTISEVLSGVENQIAQIGNGAPIVVSTAASMIDTTKTYLYMGNEVGYYNGDWYYYDGTNWVAGGSYGGSTVDAVLSPTSVNPVQNKAVTTRINDVYDELDGNVNTINSTIQEILISMAGKIDGARVADGYLYLTSEGEDVVGPLGPFSGGGGGGGGGSSGNNAIISVTNTSGWLSKTISDTESCSISFTWSSEEDGISTGAGTINLKVNGSTKVERSIDQGAITMDITRYLSNGSNVVRASVSDVYGNTKTLSFSVSVVAFNLSSTFDDTLAYNGSVVFPYVATGATTKRMQFVLDGTVVGYTDVTTSGRQQNYTIPAQTHGSHTFELYFTSEINGSTVESNHLYYDIMFTESGNNTPIISSSLKTRSVNQYYTVTIPYTVYTPNSMTSNVEIWENGVLKQELNVDRTKHQYAFRAYTTGTITVEIKSGSVTKTFEFVVIPSVVNVSAETNALDLYLTPHGRSNAEENPDTWTYNGYTSTFNGFDWSSNGWLTDDDGYQVLRLTNNARVNINYPLFGSDLRITGKTIEIDFATKNVADPDAIIITCLDGTRGLYFTPTHCSLASEQISIEGTYKDEEHTRVSFVIEKRAENRLIYIYINGIISGLIQYPNDDNFEQINPLGIMLGNNYCTLDIYAIRVYNNSLTRYQILDNWIADTNDGYTLLQRYEHNNVYDAYGDIVISNLPNDLPYLVVSAPKLPQFKGDKKTIYGYYVDPLNQAKSFTFTNAQIDVQGTSSQFYSRKNYKIKFNGGFDMTETIGEVLSKYQLREDSIPTKTFCFKADVASSEGANNVELARLYDDICPYKTDPQKVERTDGNKVRQGIDGFPIVIFWNDTANSKTVFLGKYNFNNDKGTEDVYGLNQGDESWEVRNNVSDRVLWKSADYSDTSAETGWPADFEARYPEDNTTITNLANMAAWLVTTDRDAATDEALAESVVYDDITYTTDSAEYRLAKFKNEIGDYWELQDLIFYYLFTEVFLMVDSRGKNMFPTLYEGDKWALLPYDFDTAIGIDNNGKLAFGWWLEDTDLVPNTTSTNIYNAQNSVLWVNVRDAFHDEIKSMYQSLRTAGSLSYDVVEQRFENHQNIWPEAIFNEDAYFKYIAPLTNPDVGEAPDGTYLVMAQGSKASQRQWWLYNRFKYLDSKYEVGEAISKYLYFKTNGVGDLTITPFDNVYLRTMFGQAILGPIRGTKNTPYTFISPLDTANDTEVAIYSADYIKDIGDISALKVSVARIASATRLTSLKVGDEDSNYSNTNLTELQTGTNALLKTIDASNCPNLVSPVDLSQCHNLETVKFGGTSITGIDLPNGGNLQTLVLPNTITNLTIRNQRSLQSITIPSYSQLTSLRFENVGVKQAWWNAVSTMIAGSRVRVVGGIKNDNVQTNGANGTTSLSSTKDPKAVDANSTYSITNIVNKISSMRGLDALGNNMENPQLDVTFIRLGMTPAQYSQLLTLGEGIKVHTMLSTEAEEIPYTWHAGQFNSTIHGSANTRTDFSWIDFELDGRKYNSFTLYRKKQYSTYTGDAHNNTSPAYFYYDEDWNQISSMNLSSLRHVVIYFSGSTLNGNIGGPYHPTNNYMDYFKIYKPTEYHGDKTDGARYVDQGSTWDLDWDYTDGLLSANGFTLTASNASNATETLMSDHLKLYTNGNNNITLSPATTSSSTGVMEVEFEMTNAVNTSTSGLKFNFASGKKRISVIVNPDYLFLQCGFRQYLPKVLPHSVDKNTRYKLTIVMNADDFQIYLDNKQIYSGDDYYWVASTAADLSNSIYLSTSASGQTCTAKLYSVKYRFNRIN